mmetsp:Transcript_174872/g.560714  ORF Transcript_174872/g.560714 Transcript_174872/m.560714 type:complete len:224 (+) Transcript_174872:1408-2079(+)
MPSLASNFVSPPMTMPAAARRSGRFPATAPPTTSSRASRGPRRDRGGRRRRCRCHRRGMWRGCDQRPPTPAAARAASAAPTGSSPRSGVGGSRGNQRRSWAARRLPQKPLGLHCKLQKSPRSTNLHRCSPRTHCPVRATPGRAWAAGSERDQRRQHVPRCWNPAARSPRCARPAAPPRSAPAAAAARPPLLWLLLSAPAQPRAKTGRSQPACTESMRRTCRCS